MSKAIVAGGYGPKDTVHVDLAADDQISFTRIPAPEEDEASTTDAPPLLTEKE